MILCKEITDHMADHPQSPIFRQSENRLHAQKALLLGLLSEKSGK
jgi:ornithine carbamoyltransferase